MQEPRIIEKPDLAVIGCEASFLHALSPEATNFEVIGPLWERLMPRVEEIPHRAGRQMYGVIYGLPEEQRSHRDELQYIAGAPVTSTDTVPDGMVAYRVPAGRFAVFVHRGPILKIADTVGEAYQDWLPQSAYVHSLVADVELYGERFHPDRDDSEMEYWISLKPKP